MIIDNFTVVLIGKIVSPDNSALELGRERESYHVFPLDSLFLHRYCSLKWMAYYELKSKIFLINVGCFVMMVMRMFMF